MLHWVGVHMVMMCNDDVQIRIMLTNRALFQRREYRKLITPNTHRVAKYRF